MSLNCNEINLILEELNLEGGFIQDIIQPNFDSLALYTYKEGCAKTVFICTAHDACRINETRRKITKNEKPLRFMEFLRSRIKGCRINSVRQIGLERIIKMEISHLGEEFNFYIRLWNNAANVVLCDKNNVILDSMFRRPAKGEVKGGIFSEPEIDEAKFFQTNRFPIREREDGKTFNEQIDIFYSEHATTLSREALLAKAEKWYATNKTKRESALRNLQEKYKSFQNAGQLKHFGDLIMAFGHLIGKQNENQSEGQDEIQNTLHTEKEAAAHTENYSSGLSKYLVCEDYETGKTVSILIDPKLSAHENAEKYYSNYKKAVSGSEELLHDIEMAKKQIAKIEEQYHEILSEQNPVKIEQMLRHDSKPVQQQKKLHPGLDYTVNGWYILVGRDANENDELLRHHVRGDDLWLHVRDFPGGYVFIKSRKGKTVPLDILLDAANLAVYYSKARNTGKTDLYYTHVKYLRRAKNGPKGLVLPTQEKNLCITPDKERLRKLDDILNSK